jgi:membrane dipeptidase
MMIPLFDAHCDTAYATLRTGEGFWQNAGHQDIARSARFSPRVQVYAIFDKADALEERYRLQMDHIQSQLRAHSDRIALCTSASEIKKAHALGRQAALISVEGAGLIGCSVEGLERACREGVRLVNLTWNFENALSGSNDEGAGRGLTPLGRQFVDRCFDLGVLVDVSHLSDPGFWDVMALARGPVVASHSNARALCAHKRNLTDDQFRALVQNGGVVGINLYAEFLGDDPDVDTVLRHIFRFLELGGERHIGIGADLDGCDRLPKGISGVEDMGKIYEALLRAGVSEALAYDIFFGNFMRLFERIEETAK